MRRTARQTFKVDSSLLPAHDPDAFFASLTRIAMTLVRAEGGCAGLRSPQGMVCARYLRKSNTIPFRRTWAPGEGLPGRLILAKRPCLARARSKDGIRLDGIPARFGVTAALSMPILGRRGRLLGFLEVHRRGARSGFARSDQETLRPLVRLAALALEGVIDHAGTRRRLALARRNESRYRRLIDSAVEGISRTTPGGRFVAANPALARMLGYASPRDLIDSVTDLARQVYVDPRQRLDGMRRVKKSGVLTTFEAQLRRKDGSSLWVSLNARVLRNRAGKPVYFESFLQDITDRKRAEEKHRESEMRYRQLIDLSPDAIFVQCEGKLVMLNQPGARLLGSDHPRQLLGRPVMEMIHPDYRDMVRARIRAMDAGETVPTVEEVFLRRDGTAVEVEVSASPLLYQGKPAAQAIARDITQRKRAERELRELSGHLLRARDEERRRIARELHDSTAQSLTALTLKLSLLSRSGPARTAAERSTLAECLALARDGVREVRTVSYLLHPPTLDEMGLCSALKWYADGYQERSGIRVALDLPSKLGRLPEEMETTLFRVVQECLTNVHRHARSPSARIALVRRLGRVSLVVSDAGRGIPTGTLSHALGARGRVGVGIAGMRERVRQLGGTIRFDSNSDGTRVTVIFPTRTRSTRDRPPDPRRSVSGSGHDPIDRIATPE